MGPAHDRDLQIGWALRPVGRVWAQRLLDELIESVGGGVAAAVTAGKSEVGRTTLLTHTLPQSQCQALTVCPAPSAGLGGGLWPYAPGILANAALQQRPAVLVDDTRWVDPESQQVPLFAVRRLAAEHVVIVLAIREEPEAAPAELDSPILQIGRLPVTECAELFRGSPLAVLEDLARATNETGASDAMRRTPDAALENAPGSTNRGPTTWTTAKGYHLGSQALQGNREPGPVRQGRGRPGSSGVSRRRAAEPVASSLVVPLPMGVRHASGRR